MTTRFNDRLWTVDDEERECEYVVRIAAELETADAGDRQTPAYGGGLRLLDVTVTAVNRFDDRGEVGDVETGESVRKFDDRAWAMLEADTHLLREVESALSAEMMSPRHQIPTVGAHAARKLQDRRDASKQTG